MKGIRIRDAVGADVSGLARLETQAFASDRVSPRSFRRLIASPTASLRVAGRGGAVEGYSLLFFRRGTTVARLYSLAVNATARGSGVADALMADAERFAARRGCRALRLEVRPDNRPAVHLYRRRGYRPIGIYSDYYADGSDALRFERPLGVTARARRRSGRAATASSRPVEV